MSLRRCLIVAGVLLHAALASAAIEHQNIPDPEEAPPQPVLTKPPELLHFVNAPYPEALAAQLISGGVVLHIDIDERGDVSRVEVLASDHPGFNLPAMIAATQFRFSPAEIDYAPAPIRIEYRYVFEAELPEPDAIAGAMDVPEELDARVNFRGIVREAGTRDPVVGATLELEGRYVETGKDGTFEVEGAPVGRSFQVRVTSPYHDLYKSRETVEADEIVEVTYYIYRIHRDPYETVVIGKREQREVTKITLSRREASRVPGTAGDPIRAIENLPGMGRPQNNLGTLLVRGSSPQDSKVFIDGMEVPVLYHFGGLISVVSRYMLESIDVHPGAFPARYGNATGGVVDVKTRDLDCERWRGATEPSTALVNAYTCYPLTENIKIAAAGRRSLVDLYLPAILEAVQRAELNSPDEGAIIVTPAYADYQLKLEADFGAHQLSLFAFGSDDTLAVGQTPSTERIDFDFNWHQGFHRIMLRHQWRLTDGLSLTTSAAPGVILTEFSFNLTGVDADIAFYDYNVAVREDLRWEIADGLVLRAGFDGTFGEVEYDVAVPIQDDLRPFPTPIFDFGEPRVLAGGLPTYNHAYWLDAEIEPGGGFTFIPGLRVTRWDFHHTQSSSIEARINGRWEFLEGMTAKAAYGLHERLPDFQFLFGRPFGNPKLDPERSHQFIVGYEHDFSDLIKADVQGYYYRREHLASPSRDVRFRDGQRLPVSYLSTGAGETIGLEVLLRHLATPPQDFDTMPDIVDLESFLDALSGRFYGWIAYTLSRTMRWDREAGATYTIEQGPGLSSTFEYDPLENEPYPAAFDQTHILTVVASMQLPFGVEGGVRFRLVTGNPFTPQHLGFIGVDADSDSYVSDVRDVGRNSGRMAYFHQLDLRFDKEVAFDLFTVDVYLEVTNVYGANNVDQVQYDYRFRSQITSNILPFPFAALGAIVAW